MFEVVRHGAVQVISGDQPISGDQVEELATTLRGCLANGQPFSVLNLQRIPLMDSAALELLLDAHQAHEARGGMLKLAGANSLCRDILRITRVADWFEMFTDVKSAVGSFAR
jgi:anti-anti-sigma factor